MDQTINLEHRQFKLATPAQTPAPNELSEVRYYSPSRSNELGTRGSLIFLSEFRVLGEGQFDLNKLSQTAFRTMLDTYYHSPESGGPLEALEDALNLTTSQSQQLTNRRVEIRCAALAIWGRELVYANPQNLPLGLRRNNEYFELEQGAFGVEDLKHQDLIFVSTNKFNQQLLQPKVRADQSLDNAKFVETLSQETNDQNLIAEAAYQACCILVEIIAVPSEEEVIEIHMPNELAKQPKFTQPGFLKKISGIKPVWQFINLKIWQPILHRLGERKIYLKNNLKNSKKKKLLFMILLLIALTASIFGTQRIHQDQVAKSEAAQLIEASRKLVQNADKIAALNPSQALELTDSAETTLGQVLGIRIDYQNEVDQLNLEIKDLRRKVYKIRTVTPLKTTLNDEAQSRIFKTTSNQISTMDGEILLNSDGSWQSPITTDQYMNNLYVLDPPANAIWKYVNLNGNYSGPQNYLREDALLTNSIDLSVDGSIYLLTPESVTQFTIGKKQEFRISGTFPPFGEAAQITTDPDAETFFISSGNRVLVFSKSNGAFIETLESSQESQINNIVSTNAGHEIWLNQDGEWQLVNYP